MNIMEKAKSKKLTPNPADFHPFNEAAFRRQMGGILAAKPKHSKPAPEKAPKTKRKGG